MKKPYDVQGPFILPEDRTRQLCATMPMFSRISTRKQKEGETTFFEKPEIERVLLLDPPNTANPRDRLGDTQLPPLFPPIPDIEPEPHSKLNFNQYTLDISFGPKASSYLFRERIVTQMDVARGEMPQWREPRVEIEINATSLTRWRLAKSTLEEYPSIWNRYRVPYDEAGFPHFPLRTPRTSNTDEDDFRVWEFPERLLDDIKFVDAEIQNWSGKDLLGQTSKSYPMLFLSLATACYDGLHALGWHEYFSSVLQRKVWQVFALCIAGSRVTWSIWSLCSRFVDLDSRGGNSSKICFIMLSSSVLEEIVLTTVATVYCVARGFLVLEAFVSLRRLPIAAYTTPVLTQYLPHL